MSSKECDFQKEKPREFTFTWFIRNYSYCSLEENESIESPEFEVDFSEDKSCWLSLFPRGSDTPGFVGCFLYSSKDLTFNYTLSIRKANGKFEEKDEKTYSFDKYNENGYEKLLSLEELDGPEGYLVNDTLTIRCRMWKTDADISKLKTNCVAYSRINVSKLNYTCTLASVSLSYPSGVYEIIKTIDISDFLKSCLSLKIHVMEGGSSDEDALSIGIELIVPNGDVCKISAVVHLIDVKKKVVHSAQSEYLFEGSDEIWYFPLISKHKLYPNLNLYMPKGNLTLRFELGCSNGYALETYEYQTTNRLTELQSVPIHQDLDKENVWFRSVQQCYENRKFSDFIIRTPSHQFPVSRMILSAHSKVFDAMFERDMKERKTGMVDIEDLDDDTVSKMLKYVYTGTLKVDCTSAQKLYFAADKYGIEDLQKKCSIYLASSLDASNVCDILELADRHEDQDLKSHARDFFHAHAKEIMSSESWKKLRETNLPLTSKTMEWMICNKFLM